MGLLGKIHNVIQILASSTLAAFVDILNDIITLIRILSYFALIVTVSALVSYFIYYVSTYLSPFQALSIAAGFLLLILIATR